MRKVFLIISTLFTLVIVISACQHNEATDNNIINIEEENVPNESVDDREYEKVVQASNDFGFQVVEELAGKQENIFISPVSLYMALSMVYPSTVDETKLEMEEMLQLEDFTIDEMKQVNAIFYEKLQKHNTDNTLLQIANSIWIADTFKLKDDYIETIEKDFHGKISPIDPTDDASVDEMNDWVRNKTENKITKAVEAPLAEDFVAMLFNVLYFNGKWMYPFDEANTKEDIFYGANDEENKVNYMQLQVKLDYIKTDNYEGVRLPYGENGDISLYAYLPTDSEDITSIHEAFVKEGTDVILKNMEAQKGIVKLPKFELEYEQSMNDTLQQLGMKRAFDRNKAQLSNMIEGDNVLHVSEVKQMTYLDVNEAGTEAAAATNVGIETTSAIIEDEDPFEITFNRPFVILIVDESTNTVLFIGDIYDVT